jgi:hypothetical protein
MDNSIPPHRTDVVAAQSAPRPTATPPRIQFADVLAKTAGGVVRSAERAMTLLPGAPLMALALRGGAVSSVGAAGSHGGVSAPEGPGPIGGPIGGGGAGAAGGVGSVGSGAPTDGGIESSLAQSQEMNLYFLQIQEEVNAQNRSFTVLSNVLKAEHDTVKTAIGNIR